MKVEKAKKQKAILSLLNESNNYCLKATPKELLLMTGIKYKKDLDATLQYLKYSDIIYVSEEHRKDYDCYKIISTAEMVQKTLELFKPLEKEEESLALDISEYDDIGVYRIINHKTNEVYIGSTISSFIKRFRQHYRRGQMQHTYDLLHNGGEFEILEIMNGQIEEKIRQRELEYIEKYNNDPKYILINKIK